MASGTGEPSTGHDAELDELLDSKSSGVPQRASLYAERAVVVLKAAVAPGTSPPPPSLCQGLSKLMCSVGPQISAKVS